MSKVLFTLFVLAVYCSSLNKVHGMPNLDSVQNFELMESTHNITKRQYGTGLGADLEGKTERNSFISIIKIEKCLFIAFS